MILVSEATLVLFVTLIQALGLISLASIRMRNRWKRCLFCQTLFFVSLSMVGASAMLCLHCRHNAWLFCAITLSMMVVGATFDAGPLRSRCYVPANTGWVPRS